MNTNYKSSPQKHIRSSGAKSRVAGSQSIVCGAGHLHGEHDRRRLEPRLQFQAAALWDYYGGIFQAHWYWWDQLFKFKIPAKQLFNLQLFFSFLLHMYIPFGKNVSTFTYSWFKFKHSKVTMEVSTFLISRVYDMKCQCQNPRSTNLWFLLSFRTYFRHCKQIRINPWTRPRITHCDREVSNSRESVFFYVYGKLWHFRQRQFEKR